MSAWIQNEITVRNTWAGFLTLTTKYGKLFSVRRNYGNPIAILRHLDYHAP